MTDPALRRKLSESQETIRSLQDELTETNKGLLALAMELEERVDQRTSQLRIRAEQQTAVALLGQAALDTPELEEILSQAVSQVATTLAVDQIVVAEVVEDPGALVLRAAHLPSGLPEIGTPQPFDREDGPWRSILSGEPRAWEDLSVKPWFGRTALFKDLAARGSIFVPIGGSSRPLGVLAAFTAKPRRFAGDAVVFLQAVSNVLASAVARSEAAKALAVQVRELERSNTELEQFAYIASHDLQEPLRMVSAFMRLLKDENAARLGKAANEYIDFAMDGASRMQSLIRDLLRYSRIGTAGRELEPVDAAEAMDAALLNLVTAKTSSAAEITCDPLPTVMADPNQLVQLLQNLIGNALKFTGEDQPLVHVGAEAEGDGWRFSVRDNGIGIKPDEVDEVFGLFHRAHGRGEYAGTGIGLAICAKTVERHGGRIWVESEPGVGSTFFFTLRGVD